MEDNRKHRNKRESTALVVIGAEPIVKVRPNVAPVKDGWAAGRDAGRAMVSSGVSERAAGLIGGVVAAALLAGAKSEFLRGFRSIMLEALFRKPLNPSHGYGPAADENG